jgi:hypothetical protein
LILEDRAFVRRPLRSRDLDAARREAARMPAGCVDPVEDVDVALSGARRLRESELGECEGEPALPSLERALHPAGSALTMGVWMVAEVRPSLQSVPA